MNFRLNEDEQQQLNDICDNIGEAVSEFRAAVDQLAKDIAAPGVGDKFYEQLEDDRDPAEYVPEMAELSDRFFDEADEQYDRYREQRDLMEEL